MSGVGLKNDMSVRWLEHAVVDPDAPGKPLPPPAAQPPTPLRAPREGDTNLGVARGRDFRDCVAGVAAGGAAKFDFKASSSSRVETEILFRCGEFVYLPYFPSKRLLVYASCV